MFLISHQFRLVDDFKQVDKQLKTITLGYLVRLFDDLKKLMRCQCDLHNQLTLLLNSGD